MREWEGTEQIRSGLSRQEREWMQLLKSPLPPSQPFQICEILAEQSAGSSHDYLPCPQCHLLHMLLLSLSSCCCLAMALGGTK